MRTDEFYDYLVERERIRLKKLDKTPWPWTEDKILQQFKFTNVQREHDKTSMAFRRLYTAHYKAPPEQILLNCTIARYFGTNEFLEAVGWQTTFNSAVARHLKTTAAHRLKLGLRVFTGAYVITNQGISAPKQEVVVDYFINDLWESREAILKWVRTTGSWEETLSRLQEVQGFGGSGFMAKEVTLDTMFFPGFWPDKRGKSASYPKDYSTWTPIGPGAQRGIMRLFGKSPRPKLQSEEAAIKAELRSRGLPELLRLCAAQKDHWPKDWGVLAPTDIQFGLCEWDKYERTRLKEGTPRSRYHQPE